MTKADVSPYEQFIDAMMAAVLDADEQDLAEDALIAGEDLTGTSRHLRARFLDRVALARARDVGLEQMILAEVGAALAACLDYDHTLQTIAELAVRRMAPMCVVSTIEDDATSRLTVLHGEPTKVEVSRALEKFSTDLLPAITQSVLDSRRPQIFEEKNLLELGVASALAVPLSSSTDVVGVLVLASCRPRQFGTRDISLATEFAFRAVLAIENARRHEAEQRAIRERDEMLESVAHDLRSPLHSINLAAQLLERKFAKAGELQCKRHLDVIMESVDRANQLVQKLIDVSRTDVGSSGRSKP